MDKTWMFSCQAFFWEWPHFLATIPLSIQKGNEKKDKPLENAGLSDCRPMNWFLIAGGPRQLTVSAFLIKCPLSHLVDPFVLNLTLLKRASTWENTSKHAPRSRRIPGVPAGAWDSFHLIPQQISSSFKRASTFGKGRGSYAEKL
jgi:hypothetical protein